MSVTMADGRTSKKIIDAKKPIDRVQSLAETIIFCMAEDAPAVTTTSGNATPGTSTPLPPAIARLQNGSSMKKTASTDSLAAAGRKSEEEKKYLGGSKAMDHLSRLLTSCETVSKGIQRPLMLVLPSIQLGSLVSILDRLPLASSEQLCRKMEGRRRALVQDSSCLETDTGDQARIRALSQATGSHRHVQQGKLAPFSTE